MSFVHLHVHSQYSLLDGTMSPKLIAKRAAQLQMPSVALTDSCNLYGGVAFYKACKAHGVRPVLGCVLNVQPEGLEYVDPLEDEGGYKLIALIEDDTGYKNLCRLITDGIFDGVHFKPRVDLQMIEKHRDGLMFLTCGRKGVIGRALMAGKPDRARAALVQLRERLADDQLFVELQDLGLHGQEAVLAGARSLATELSIPTVVTNAVHYQSAHNAPAHEVLNAIALGTSLSDSRRAMARTDQAWFKTEQEMRELFPDDSDAIDRTEELALRCDYHYDFKTYHFPATTPPDFNEEGAQPDTDSNWEYFYRAFPPPKDYGLPKPEVAIPDRPDGSGNMNGYFEWYSVEGLKLRLQQVPDLELHSTYYERLKFEMDVIESMGFPAYMLIVAEFINWSKDNHIPVGPGRGSAAGSLVAYAMRITDIDPIRFGLLFERFLNPERVSMPDIDVDFCQDRREEAIEHVREKYGSPLVSQIITYGTLKAKAAVRDVSRVMDLNYNDADRISKLIPDELKITIASAIDQVEMLQRMRDGDPKVRRVLAMASAVEGLCRQTGVHAAGVVIADRPLVEYAPLYRDGPDGGPVVQYDMKSAESIGLIKFDFLGLKTLDQIRDAVQLIERNYGLAVDVNDLPLDDLQTYTLLQAGDGLGVFQLESDGMRKLLVRLQPNCVDDMVALVALYRPGPLQSGMTDDFVERKHGRTDVTYPLPCLEPLLKGTYGTIIYQEQVMQIAQVMAGYSLGEADILRRAMGKKDADEMDRQRSRFVGGSVDNDIEEDIAEGIFDLMAKFAAYGFNKSHSAAYGYISFQTAYLKAHYRPEYMAALMSIESGNTDKVLLYIRDCQQHSIRVESPCINRSERAFEVPLPSERTDGDVIIYGLKAIKNVGGGAVTGILEARKAAGGHFKDAYSFFRHVDYKKVNRRVIEQLIKAGAFDFCVESRCSLLQGLQHAITLGAREQADAAAGQRSLFGGAGSVVQSPKYRFPDVPEWPLSERLAFERDALGLYLSGHPMQVHQADVKRYASSWIHELQSLDHGSDVRVIGVISDTRVVRTRTGDRMAIVQIDDVEGVIEGVLFSGVWARSRRVVEAGEPLLVSGMLEEREQGRQIRVRSVELLSEVRARATRDVTFTLTADELEGKRLDQFLRVLKDHSGTCPTRLVVEVPGRFQATLGLPSYTVNAGAPLEEHMLSIFGRHDAVVLH